MSCSPHPLHVDAVEQHGQLGGIHLDRAAIAREARRSKSTELKALVTQDEMQALRPYRNILCG
jgi:hypothetical protein